MRSKAHFQTHPIHPMLIPFPLAFLFGAFLFNAGGILLQKASWWTTGAYLTVAGIVAALLAAVPGIIDYLHVVPPKSSAKTRAAKHGIVNVSAVVLFALSYWIRGGAAEAPTWLGMGLQAVGLGLITAGGRMGGTLVYHNYIGVYPRYANGGKWQEDTLEVQAGQAVTVAQADDLKVDNLKLLYVNNRRIVLGRTEEGYVAFDDHCTHKGGSLAHGPMICGTVQCPWHGSQFDVKTGAVKAGPAKEQINVYRVEQIGKEVKLYL